MNKEWFKFYKGNNRKNSIASFEKLCENIDNLHGELLSDFVTAKSIVDIRLGEKILTIQADNFSRFCKNHFKLLEQMEINKDKFLGYTSDSVLTIRFKEEKFGAIVESNVSNYNRFAEARKNYYKYLEDNGCKPLTAYEGKEKKILIKFKCGHEEWKLPTERNCPYCDGKKVLKGFNDIATTHPHLVKYLANEEDAYNYSAQTNKPLLLKCPKCGKTKEGTLGYTIRQGYYSCPYCLDNTSYPEKFVSCLLQQLEVKYIPQLTCTTFEWVGLKRYDFYIPSLNCIIETHGMQHYIYKEQKINDEYKEKIAIDNNIDIYIQLDCRYSTKDFVKESILNSKINEVFNLKNIDWDKCHNYASTNSKLIEVCEVWNRDDITYYKQVIEIVKDISETTCKVYLQRGKELGLIDKYYKGRKK